jgi:hypothetical protein
MIQYFLEDIINSINDIQDFIRKMKYEDFINDKKTIAAVTPNGSNHWSQADLSTFKQKPVNIILGHPYAYSSIAVYNQIRDPIEFEIEG